MSRAAGQLDLENATDTGIFGLLFFRVLALAKSTNDDTSRWPRPVIQGRTQLWR